MPSPPACRRMRLYRRRAHLLAAQGGMTYTPPSIYEIRRNSNDFSDKFIIDAHGKWKNRDFEADEYGYLSIYRFQLISTSKKSIPKKLSYIGNFLNLTPPDKEFIMEIKENIRPIDWKKVEEDVLTKYFLYNKRESVIYDSLDR